MHSSDISWSFVEYVLSVHFWGTDLYLLFDVSGECMMICKSNYFFTGMYILLKWSLDRSSEFILTVWHVFLSWPYDLHAYIKDIHQPVYIIYWKFLC